MSSIKSDLELGKRAELVWIEYLKQSRKTGLTYEQAPDRWFPDWDVKDSNGMTFEVKYDTIASKTNNYFFEYNNPRSNKLSGLSTTKADWFVYLIRYPSEELDIRASVFCSKSLLSHCREAMYPSRKTLRDVQRTDSKTPSSWGGYSAEQLADMEAERSKSNAEGWLCNIPRLQKKGKIAGFYKELRIPSYISSPLL